MKLVMDKSKTDFIENGARLDERENFGIFWRTDKHLSCFLSEIYKIWNRPADAKKLKF